MLFEELESSEIEGMKFKAFKVCNELTFRMEGAPSLKVHLHLVVIKIMKVYTSQKNE